MPSSLIWKGGTYEHGEVLVLVSLCLACLPRGHGARDGVEVLSVKINITNRLGLPEPIVHAVANDPYDAGEGTSYSVTGLLKPPRMAQLSKRAEVTEDAADRIFALQGQVMHLILERAGNTLREAGYVAERRFYKVYFVDGKHYTISAQIDLFDPKTGILSDYKYTSVAAAKHGLKEDHRLQLNVQAQLLRTGFYKEEGTGKPVFPDYQVDRAEVVLILRDWSAERSYEGYPDSPAVKQVVQFMPSAEVDAWIVDRIRLHEAAKSQLPLCSAEERWNRPTFAVMKNASAARATRVFDTRDEAEAFLLTEKGQGQMVVERSGQDVRCLRYCPARSVCSQAKDANPELAAPIVDNDGFLKVS